MSVQNNFRVETQITDRAVTLILGGELDLVSSPVLEQALDSVSGSPGGFIVFDLRQLEFMDSTGLHLLIGAQQRAHAAGRRFALIRGGEQVQRLLDLAGVADALHIVDSLEDLVEVDPAPRTS